MEEKEKLKKSLLLLLSKRFYNIQSEVNEFERLIDDLDNYIDWRKINPKPDSSWVEGQVMEWQEATFDYLNKVEVTLKSLEIIKKNIDNYGIDLFKEQINTQINNHNLKIIEGWRYELISLLLRHATPEFRRDNKIGGSITQRSVEAYLRAGDNRHKRLLERQRGGNKNIDKILSSKDINKIIIEIEKWAQGDKKRNKYTQKQQDIIDLQKAILLELENEFDTYPVVRYNSGNNQQFQNDIKTIFNKPLTSLIAADSIKEEIYNSKKNLQGNNLQGNNCGNRIYKYLDINDKSKSKMKILDISNACFDPTFMGVNMMWEGRNSESKLNELIRKREKWDVWNSQSIQYQRSYTQPQAFTGRDKQLLDDLQTAKEEYDKSENAIQRLKELYRDEENKINNKYRDNPDKKVFDSNVRTLETLVKSDDFKKEIDNFFGFVEANLDQTKLQNLVNDYNLIVSNIGQNPNPLLLIYKAIKNQFCNYWLEKFKNDISNKVKIFDDNIKYGDEKFGDSSISSFRLFISRGIKKKLKDAGLGDLLNIILKKTYEEYYKSTSEKIKFKLKNISDENIKKLLYSLETNKPLKDEICSANPDLESKLMNFIKELKDLKKKEEDDKRKRSITRKRKTKKKKDKKKKRQKKKEEKMKRKNKKKLKIEETKKKKEV